MRIHARHYATGQPCEVVCTHGCIAAINAPAGQPPDLTGSWIAPALFDLQINGCGGIGFTSPLLTPEGVRQVAEVCLQHGIGGFLATLITNSFSVLAHGMSVIDRACATDPVLARVLAGIHLEGPYLSAEDGPRGAHPREHIRPANWDEFRRLQDAAGGRIRLVTLAPESEGAIPLTERLAAAGVVVALGHTAASGEQIRAAVAAGARLSTHLGNGAHAVLPRHPNYIWEQLAEDRLWASLICDGHHLPPSVIKCFLRVKTPQRLVLTCDASSLAGLSPGRYREWGQDLEVQAGGRVVLAGTQYLAGSGVFTETCVGHVLRCADLSLAEAVDMASLRPRQLLGLPPCRLLPGDPADLVLFDWEPGGALQVRATLLGGEVVAGPVKTALGPASTGPRPVLTAAGALAPPPGTGSTSG